MSLPMTGPTAPSALDPDGVELARVARRFLATRSPSAVVRGALEAGVEVLPPFWDELVGLGWIGLAAPAGAGGQGATPAELCTVVEEWGRVVAPGPFPTTAAAATVLGRFAPHLVGPILAGAPAAIVLDPDGPVDGGGAAQWFIAPDPSQSGPDTWVLAPRAAVGVEVPRAADPTRRPARVVVDRDRLRDAERFAAPRLHVEHTVALIRAAESVGVASWCVHTAARYASDRVQFGHPIGRFQAVKHRCADSLCRLEAARSAVWDAARLDPDDPQFALAVAAAAALAPVAAFECAEDCIQVLGGVGYTWEHDAHLYLRRATAARFMNGEPSAWRSCVVDLAVAGTRRTLAVELPAEAEDIRARVKAEVAALAATDRSTWNIRLADGGWVCPHWPAPWGRDAGPLEQLVIDQELRAVGIRRPHLQVAGWVLPTLIAHGTRHQQDRFIGPSLRHEMTWCQLFSEPEAGSDLASLTTAAVRVDGGWSITGQKVWTTMANEADWGICLARTDPDAPKHDGITCFLVDMSTPGIDVRPLRELTGFAMFNEVFLDGVVVPDEMVVGAVHDGWRCARTTLENERVSMASGSSFGPGVVAVLDLAVRRHALDDAVVRDAVGSLLVTSQALAVMGLRTTVRAIGESDVVPGPEASIRKLMGVEHEQRVQEAGMSLLGAEAVVDEGDGARWFGGFLGNRALSIAGGTSEIQRNVIAERLLGLPRD